MLELPLENVPALADEDAVEWFEPPLPKFSALSHDSRLRTGNFSEGSISQGATVRMVVLVTPTDNQLKVTLA